MATVAHYPFDESSPVPDDKLPTPRPQRERPAIWWRRPGGARLRVPPPPGSQRRQAPAGGAAAGAGRRAPICFLPSTAAA